jgi:hypothetical protein
MKCPHCQNDMKRRERNGTCTKCNKKYALDPKTNDFALHDARLVKLVAKLSDGGKLLVSDDHLRHFLARKTADESGGGGCLLFMLTLISAVAITPELIAAGHTLVGVLLPLFFLTLALALTFGRKPRPFPRNKLKTTPDLRAKLREYTEVYGDLPPGLILADAIARRPERCLPTGPMHAVVVTPSVTAIDALRINGVAERHGVGLLCTTRRDDIDAQEILHRLRERPSLPILLFHDASPEGLLLAEDLPTQLSLRPEQRILDMGLFPRRSIAKKRLCLGVPVHEPSLARLRARGEPQPGTTRALRPKRAALADAELAWLAEGRTTPIESLMPRDLIQRVTAACARLTAKQPDDRALVRDFGFMTSPSRPA